MRVFPFPAVETNCPHCGGDGLIPIPSAQHVNYFAVCPCNAHWSTQEGVVRGQVYGGNHHPVVLLKANGWVAWVDEGIADDVRRLWEAGIGTWVSCQGDEDDALYSRYLCLLSSDRAIADHAMEMLPWARQATWCDLNRRRSDGSRMMLDGICIRGEQ